MRTWLRVLAGAVCAAALSAQPQQKPLREHPDVAGAVRLYESWVTEQMTYRGLPGVAVGVVHDQQVIWSRGFGYADVAAKTPVTPATIFRMASHTKMFTAIAILQLRDAGKLRLDDPVSKHLAWFHIKPAAEDDPPVTIEELLTHNSGLPREATSPYWATFEFPTEEQIRQTVNSQQATYPPQAIWKYSNLAFALAGFVVEAVSGEKYADYVDRHILRPLGMTNSSIEVPSGRMSRLAKGYGRRMPDGSRKTMPFSDTRGVGPAAGLSSTLDDMLKYASFQFRTGKAGGSQILSGATLREMHRPRVLRPKWMGAWGLGFSVQRQDDKIMVGHGGSLAGYKTHTLVNLDDKVGVVVLSNGDDTRPEQFAQRAMKIIGDAIAKAAKPPEKQKTWDPKWSKYSGLYRTIWSDTAVVEMNRELVIIDPLTDDPQEGLLRLVPQEGGVFKLEGPAGFGAAGETVRFEEDSQGRVVRMFVGELPAERVEK